jgi:uncharacterized protein (DUF2236 family)
MARPILTSARPVVVAENMIGVAMYELVRHPLPHPAAQLTQSRFRWAMINLLAKSFESRRIELLSKSTKRQVCDSLTKIGWRY